MRKPHYVLLFLFTIMIQFYGSSVLNVAERHQLENDAYSPDLSLEMQLLRADTQKTLFQDLLEASKYDKNFLLKNLLTEKQLPFIVYN